ncbi:MAG: hypothetical protein ACXVCI_12120 [Bdellovibrionota bacterium]
MTTPETLSALKEFLAQEAPGLNTAEPLIEQVNSLQLVSLVMLLQKKFSISIENIEINENNFGSLDNLALLVEKKLSRFEK